MHLKHRVDIVGIPICKFCKRKIYTDDDGWGVAKDLITGIIYYYHMECLEMEEL